MGVRSAGVQTYHVIGLETHTPTFSMSVNVAMVTVFDLIFFKKKSHTVESWTKIEFSLEAFILNL